MTEYLHNLTLTASWLWLVFAAVSLFVYIPWALTEEWNNGKIARRVGFWVGSFILVAVGLWTYYH